jgi:hypothetical protein
MKLNFIRPLGIAAILLLCAVFCQGQKINQCNYKNVDTLIKYKNAETISYKKNGKQVVDTVYFSKMKCTININSVDVMIVDEDKILKRPK